MTTGRAEANDGDDIPTVLLEPELDGSAPGGADPARNRAWVVAASVVVVAVIAVALLAATRTGDESAEPTPTTTPDQDGERDADDEPDPDVDMVPAEVDAAAPWDGKASMRLPVTVTPNRDLVDGSEVTVSGSGFPPNVELGVLMCTNDAVFSGIGGCDLSTAWSRANGFPIVTDAQGTFTTRYRVQTTVNIVDPGLAGPSRLPQERQHDCTSGDIDPDVWPSVLPPSPDADPGGFTCIIAAGMISDYDTSGGAAIGFAGSTFRTFEVVTPTTAPDDALTTVPPPTVPQTTTSLAGRMPTTSTPPPIGPGATTTRVPPPITTSVPGTAPSDPATGS